MCDNVLQIPEVFPELELNGLVEDEFPPDPCDETEFNIKLQFVYKQGFRRGEQISVQNTIISLAHLLRCNKITAGMTNLEIAKLVTEEMRKRYE